PFECCNRTDPDAEDYCEKMLTRVGGFKGDAARGKLERFRMEDLAAFDDFSARKLNDTRYASKEARKYLSWLYGDDTNRYIQAGTGQVTALLRNAWRLNSILGDGGQKTRDDHRHHAVDAICIAATTPTLVKELSRAAERQLKEKGRTRGFWKLLETPWDDFLQDMQDAVDGIVVSHRPSRKIMGRLHEETIYSPPRIGPDGKEYVHFRKPIGALSTGEIEKIVDDTVRDAVKGKLEDLKEKNPAKAFKDTKDHPSRNGIPIHSVRLRDNRGTVRVGKGHRARNVWGRGNHHIEIYEVLDGDGNVKKWEGKVVTTLGAVGRVTRLRALKAQRAAALERGDKDAANQLDLRMKENPVIQRDHGPNTRFLFSLTQNDVIEVDVENGDEESTRELYVVCGVTIQAGGRLQCSHVADARKKADIPTRMRSKDAARSMYLPTVGSLMRDRCIKMQVDAIGNVFPARD
ncbi:MAG: hypothetical protein GY851_32715, partial [bacterium]|nr:hypothetical protein [bacterium]